MMHTFLATALDYLREFVEVATLGFFLAGLLNAVLNRGAIVSRLTGNVVVANALAATWGFTMPLCCCSGIPTALTLYRSGSRRGPACAFLIAVPWFNWYGMTALVVFLGWRDGLTVSLCALLIGVVAGVLIDLLGDRSATIPVTVCGSTCETEECSPSVVASHARAPLLDFSNPAGKILAGLRYAVGLLREVGPWMLAGIALGAAMQAAVPRGFVETYLGKATVTGLLLSVAVAAAFYTDSLATLPWVRTLLDKGLGVGSGMILLVAGVGTNVSALGPVARTMGLRTAVIYCGSVVVLTALLGFALNRFF